MQRRKERKGFFCRCFQNELFSGAISLRFADYVTGGQMYLAFFESLRAHVWKFLQNTGNFAL